MVIYILMIDILRMTQIIIPGGKMTDLKMERIFVMGNGFD